MNGMAGRNELRGQRVVVIGGTSGMGLGVVRAAAAAGAEVIAAGRSAASSPETEPRIVSATVDMTDEESIRALFEGLPSVDHLVITATPPAGTGAFLEHDLAFAQRFMNAKFFGSWTCARHAAPKMPATGSITFTTGGISVRPRAGATMATAAFAALEAFSRALAVELGPIRVNTIRPGVIDSPMWSFLESEKRNAFFRSVASTFPARRVGTIEDIGHAAVFLMTNPYVTGTVLEVTGGETLVSLPEMK